jgi:hypothetical protein
VHRPADWFKIDQRILHNCPGIGHPKNIDALTLSEIALCLSDPDKPGPAGAASDMSPEDIAEHLMRWRAMSPRDKLEWIRANG